MRTIRLLIVPFIGLILGACTLRGAPPSVTVTTAPTPSPAPEVSVSPTLAAPTARADLPHAGVSPTSPVAAPSVAGPTRLASPVPTASLPAVLVGTVALQQPVGHIFWYRPDGLWLVNAVTDTTRLQGIRDGDQVTGTVTVQRVAPQAAAAAWSPNGDQLALLVPSPPGVAVTDTAPFLVPQLLDVTTGQTRTFTRLRLSPGSGVAWAVAAGRVSVYAIPYEAPNCLLRIDPGAGTGETAWCAPMSRQRLLGEFAALPDGKLAVPMLEMSADAGHGGGLSLLTFDPAAGHAGIAYGLFASEGWQLGPTSFGLRLPLALSPDGQMLSALAGPSIDPADTLGDYQGLYVVDLKAGEIAFPGQDPRVKMGWPGLRAAVWSADSRRLAMGGLGREGPVTLVYDRAENQVRRPLEAAGNTSFTMAPHLGTDGYEAWRQDVTMLPLAWPAGNPETTNAIGRRLLGFTPLAPNPGLFQPLLVWTDPSSNEVNPAVEFP